MSLTAEARTQLLGRIATDRHFRRLLVSNPRKAADDLGIALSESDEARILTGLREIRMTADRTRQLLGDAAMAPFMFAVLLTHDDAGDEDEDEPGSGNGPAH